MHLLCPWRFCRNANMLDKIKRYNAKGAELLLCIFFLGAFPLVIFLLYRPARKHQPDAALFLPYARLAEISYKDLRTPITGKGYEFEHVGDLLNRRVQIWRKVLFSKSPGSPKYVVVIRGTSTIQDLFQDLHLVVGATGFHTNDLIRTVEQIDRQLSNQDYVADLSKEKITFVGHSLGGSIAESLLICRHFKGIKGCTAISFDSPGQPDHFHSTYQTAECVEGSYTLNSTPNLVNMMFKSRARYFYVCGSGQDFAIQQVVATVVACVGQPVLSLARTFMGHNVAAHGMVNIREHVERGEIALHDQASWILLSSQCLGGISRAASLVSPPFRHLYNRVWKGTTLPLAPTIPEAASVAIRTAVVPPSPSLDNAPRTTSDLPEGFENIQLFQQYHVTERDWQRLQEWWRSTDVIIPFFGASGSGKSTTLNRLCLEAGGVGNIPTGGGVNNSTSPVLIPFFDDCEGRVFLLDWPGFGAERLVRNEAFIRGLRKTMEMLYDKIVCAVYIASELPLDCITDVYKILVRMELKVLPVLNAKNCRTPGDLEARLRNWRSVVNDMTAYIAEGNDDPTGATWKSFRDLFGQHVNLNRQSNVAAAQLRGREKKSVPLINFTCVNNLTRFVNTDVGDFRTQVHTLDVDGHVAVKSAHIISQHNDPLRGGRSVAITTRPRYPRNLSITHHNDVIMQIAWLEHRANTRPTTRGGRRFDPCIEHILLLSVLNLLRSIRWLACASCSTLYLPFYIKRESYNQSPLSNSSSADIREKAQCRLPRGIVVYAYHFLTIAPQREGRVRCLSSKRYDSGEIRTLAPEGNRLAVCRLNHSATLSSCLTAHVRLA
ncbi:hypothetical protein PROFUN_00361 [Planoprotostelium fungivorum]|uniref:Uncharacterized protein n=1 Tax=Planoprotostelium fungivorum TaxID=1890364 RepID=A0A2P6NY54_9EUKA|nr:hypothetical protein PROFUN_00361 [Planoprotostelium fungivorum]